MGALVRVGSSRVPILTRVREPAFVVDTKGNNWGRQVLGGINFVEEGSLQQRFPVFCWKLCHVCVAEALHRDGKKQVKAKMFHSASLL
jgi:hypothetical protein